MLTCEEAYLLGKLVDDLDAESVFAVGPVPVEGEVRGHPVLLDASVFDEVLSGDAPEGARSVVRRDPERILRVPVSDVGIHDDLDTPADYRRRFPDGRIGSDPMLASVAAGARLFEAAVEDVVAAYRSFVEAE